MGEMSMYKDSRDYQRYHQRSASASKESAASYHHLPRSYEHEDVYGFCNDTDRRHRWVDPRPYDREELIDLRRSRKELDSPGGQIIWDDIGDSELVESLSWSQSDVEREIETWDQRLRESDSFWQGAAAWNNPDMICFNDADAEVYLPRRSPVDTKCPARTCVQNAKEVAPPARKDPERRSLYKYHRKGDLDSSGQLLLPQRSSSTGRPPRGYEIRSKSVERSTSFDRDSAKTARSKTGTIAAAIPAEGTTMLAAEVTQPDMGFYHQQTSTPSLLSPTSGIACISSRHWLGITLIVLVGGAVAVSLPYALNEDHTSFQQRLRLATAILKQVPLIDGHNDLPWNIRKFLHNRLKDFNFKDDLRTVLPWSKSAWSHTDLPRLKAGLISAQFWAAYVPCEAQFKDAVQLSFEQVDVIRRFTERYRPDLTLCTSSSDIEAAHRNGQLCSLIGVEGGHSMGSSLAILRALYEVGVRYLTLTSTCNTPWADCSLMDGPGQTGKHSGLTSFGKSVVREMNRLGMLVDLSHVSEATMLAALNVSKAPVIFSHSAAQALCNSSRNVPDHVLRQLAANDGIIMINFYSKFLSCRESASVQDAVAHIEHVRKIAGVEHVGLGAGYDGINITPDKLNDVSTYPVLFAELISAGWSEDNLRRLAGLNFIRVLRRVEALRDELVEAGSGPSEDVISPRLLVAHSNCTSSNLF